MPALVVPWGEIPPDPPDFCLPDVALRDLFASLTQG